MICDRIEVIVGVDGILVEFKIAFDIISYITLQRELKESLK